jgi:SAM-dependent methyltransferase
MTVDTRPDPSAAYDRQFAAYYDRITAHKDYGSESAALLRHIDRAIGIGRHRILDVGCGTGTHANLLAAAGHEVYAVDLSKEMIEIAKSKNGGAEFAHQDVARIDQSDFAFATSLFNVINCLPDLASLRTFLGAIYGRLSDGGGALIEAWNPVAVIAEPPVVVERVFEAGGERIVRKVTPVADFLNQRLDLRYDVAVEGSAEPMEFSVVHQLVLFTPLEIRDCLESAGFREIEVLTALPDLAPATAGSRMLAITARR